MKTRSQSSPASASISGNIKSRRLFATLVLAATVFCVCWPPLVTSTPQSGSPKALVNHGFTVDGRIEGSVQQLSNEDTTINDGAAITGNLLTPGSPTVHQNDNATIGSITQGSGSEQPDGYAVTLNGNALLGKLVKRTDAVAAPAVTTPAAATGTRDVTLSETDHDAGDFATLRDLILDGGMVSVPPGTYGSFVANSSRFILGVAGASQPSVYNITSLTLNDASQIQVVGPVVLTIANGARLSGAIGAASNPHWLTLKVAAGDVTLNAGGVLAAVVTAPSSTLTINGGGSLTGSVACDRLAVNAGGLLRIVE